MDQDSRESGLNGDGDKQILAPAEGPRENLINTAVKFLQNPKVMSSPLYQKRAFLEKKGLTQEEIQIAVTRAGVTETSTAIATASPGPPPGYQPGVIGGASHAVAGPVYAPIPPQSRWARARDLTMTTVIVAGVSYGMYQLFQKYVRPWLLGQTAQEARLDRLEGQLMDIQKSVADSMAELTKTMSSIQASLQSQQSQYSFNSHERGVSELKADIASLKGLLLSKNQFPPAPPTSVLLPAWQRAPAPSDPSPPVATTSAASSDSAMTGTSINVGSPLTMETEGAITEGSVSVSADDSATAVLTEGSDNSNMLAAEVPLGTGAESIDKEPNSSAEQTETSSQLTPSISVTGDAL